MKIICKKNHDENLPPIVLPIDINKPICGNIYDDNFVTINLEPNFYGEFRFDITAGKTYEVFGILIYDSKINYLISDDSGIPLFITSDFFQTIDDSVNTYFWEKEKILVDNKLLVIEGFYELMDYSFIISLIEQKPTSLKIFNEYKDLL
jgi:hypothetical protein